MASYENALKNVKRAYGIKEKSLAQAQAVLRITFGNALKLDVINNETRRAWGEQWRPLLAAAERERYFTERAFENGLIYVPAEGFRDSFEEAAARAESNHFNPKRFDLAIWHNAALCGVAYGGRADTDPRGVVTIDIREGSPDKKHPLKGHIAHIIDISSVAYAQNLGYKMVAYAGPYSDGALKQHERMGLRKEVVKLSAIASDECFVRDIT